jgi:hypothetical protein
MLCSQLYTKLFNYRCRSSLFERLNVRHSTVENNYVVGNGLSRDSGKIPHDEVNDAIHLKEGQTRAAGLLLF